MRVAPVIRKSALVISVLAAAGIAGRALAAEQESGVNIGQGVICDTEHQAERLAVLVADHDLPSAIAVINKESATPVACGVASIAYRENKRHANIRNDKGYYRIVEITIVATETPNGWVPIKPKNQFAAIPIPGIEV